MDSADLHCEAHLCGVVPSDHILREVAFSPDGSAAAYITSHGDRSTVFTPGASFTYDHARAIVFPGAGTLPLWQAKVRDKYHVVVGGRMGKGYAWVGRPLISADRSSIAYAAMRDQAAPGLVLVCNESESEPYDEIGAMVFSATGNALAYTARRNREWLLFIGNRCAGSYDALSSLTAIAASDRFVFGAKRSDGWVVIKGREAVLAGSGPHMPWGFSTNHDGRRLAFWKPVPGGWTATVDAEEVQRFDQPEPTVGGPYWNESGSDVAFVGRSGRRSSVVTCTGNSAAYDAVGRPVFHPTHPLCAFKARDDDQEFLVLDGQAAERFDVLWPPEGEHSTYLEDVPVFSESGRDVAYCARRGDEELVVHSGRVVALAATIAGGPALSADGSVVALGVFRDARELMVVGEKIAAYERIWSPRLSPSWRGHWCPIFCGRRHRVAFGARRGHEIWWETLDA
jgi:hypothetical protein